MVYDGGLMRSILALGLALLVLAAEAPGLFTESPVCAAADGRGAVIRPQPPAKSCCGSPSCPMHAKACGAATACPMSGADPASAATPARTGPAGSASGHKLCAPSCGSEGARAIPGVPDPGTLDLTRAPATPLAAGGTIHSTPRELPARNPVPFDPPPRA